MFVGATLLFVVQPMVGKMVLPLLGGTPAVWSTCMVFFQAALLAGYAYAHASTAWLGASPRQALLHLGVLVIPLFVLPLAVNPHFLRGGEANPVLDVLLLLSVSVGLPFFVVSATAGVNCAHIPRTRPMMICQLFRGDTSSNSSTPLSRSRRKLPDAVAATLTISSQASVTWIG